MNSIEHRQVSNSRGKRPDREEEEDDEDGDNDMAAWERTYADERSWESLQEDESGLLQAIDNTSLYHAQYRRRLRSISSALSATRIQKGLIRYLYVVMDFSRAGSEMDFRPSRMAVVAKHVEAFIREFFDQNPLSQIGLVMIKDGVADYLTGMGGSPESHIKALMSKLECSGEASLQNALELVHENLNLIPSYGHREALIVYSALSTCDPGDIMETIKKCKKSKIRCSIVGLSAEMFICKHICQETGGSYSVALDESHLKELLLEHAPPPPAIAEYAIANLIKMGFPQRAAEGIVSICVCHKEAKIGGGYTCPRCKARVCELPTECRICGLTLVSSPHLARSYHHLFPITPFDEVSLSSKDLSGQRLPQKCFGCMQNLKNPGTDLSGSLLGIKAAKWEHIWALFKKHSQYIGFSAKKSTSRRTETKDRPIIERYFRCSCEGKHGNARQRLNAIPEASTTNVRNVSITRCQCKACVRTHVNEDGVWEVVQHVIEHNHTLTPLQWQHHHRSERKISEVEGELIKAMTEAHVPPSVQFRVAAAGAGGDELVGHTKRDHINFVNRLRMKKIEGGDAATLVELLAIRQAEEPGFFFRVQFNKEGRLINIFWRDAMMREDYLLYRDVLVFDTTYRTNRYNLICGAFVGINNHWSNVMFGCAFLSDETQESFEWLFNVFNESMGEDILPVSIFTDQDKAISNAIEKVYPTSRHRLCQWHIQQNAISHFGKLKGDRPFQNLFNKCLNGCYTEVEFEETWQKMVQEYGLTGHPWFKRLYKYRHKWSTALNNEHFSAGILSSQRSESTNHALGFQASKTTSLTSFFGIYEATVKRWRSEEERKEFNAIRCKPTSVYCLADLLLHASQVYTLELFRLFEMEYALAMGTRATILPVDDPVLVYRVHHAEDEDSKHHVTFDCTNHFIECTCRKFQVMGLFCFHIIRVLHMHSVAEIPSRYIVRRWTKYSKTAVWERLLPSDIRRTAANDAVNWRRSMLIATNHIISKCHNVPEARLVVEKLVLKANEELEVLLSNMNVCEDQPATDGTTLAILDPVRCTTKGRSARKKRSFGPKKKAKKGSEIGTGCSDIYIAVPRLI